MGELSYGVCVGSPEKFEQIARPGIEAAMAVSTTVMTRGGQSSIHVAYNSIIDEFRRSPRRALVLLHDDTEIRDADFEAKVLAALSDPSVAVVGVIGGSRHKKMAWWDGEKRGRVTDRQQGLLDFGGHGDVWTVDGLLLVLSPWATEHLRFDEGRYDGFHAYDAEICAQARAAGKRVVTVDSDVFHHNDPDRPRGDWIAYQRNDLRWRLKWRTGTLRERMHWRLALAKLRASQASRRTQC